MCNFMYDLMYILGFVCVYSENAEIIGQHLSLARWIHVLEARIKGLKCLLQENGERRSLH